MKARENNCGLGYGVCLWILSKNGQRKYDRKVQREQMRRDPGKGKYGKRENETVRREE